MINFWGNSGNEGFALPIESAQPSNPTSYAGVPAWDPAQQLFWYSSLTVDRTSGDVQPAGNLNLVTGKGYKVNSTQVVGSQRTGWGAPTGTLTRTTFDSGTVTLSQLAERLAALITDLRTHGLIGN